jgi:flagellar hook protein FlgE
MTFYTSLSGLQAAQTDMSTISNNLANVSSDGFKKSRSDFADVMATNFYTAPKTQVGMGATLTQNVQQFGEGNLKTTGGALDLAISGDGFFAVQTGTGSSGAQAYTRNGAFTVGQDHTIIDSQGSALLAYPVDASGNATASGTDGLAKVTIPTTSGTPTATSKITLDVNLATGATAPTAAFDRNNPSTYNNSATTTIYDGAGNAQTLTNYFVRDSKADTDTSSGWTMYSYAGDQQLTSGGAAGVPVSFDKTGTMTSPSSATSFDAYTAPATGLSQTLSLDLAGSTQKASAFSVAARSQDGASVGEFSGISVGKDGVITASFSNGDSKALGKVAIANFTTPTGLRQLGTSYWSPTGISGTATLGSPGDNGYGSLMSGTIEGSNVDITEELVNLIAAQRNFQANSKALDTQSQLIQTIVQIQG